MQIYSFVLIPANKCVALIPHSQAQQKRKPKRKKTFTKIGQRKLSSTLLKKNNSFDKRPKNENKKLLHRGKKQWVKKGEKKKKQKRTTFYSSFPPLLSPCAFSVELFPFHEYFKKKFCTFSPSLALFCSPEINNNLLLTKCPFKICLRKVQFLHFEPSFSFINYNYFYAGRIVVEKGLTFKSRFQLCKLAAKTIELNFVDWNRVYQYSRNKIQHFNLSAQGRQ